MGLFRRFVDRVFGFGVSPQVNADLLRRKERMREALRRHECNQRRLLRLAARDRAVSHRMLKLADDALTIATRARQTSDENL